MLLRIILTLLMTIMTLIVSADHFIAGRYGWAVAWLAFAVLLVSMGRDQLREWRAFLDECHAELKSLQAENEALKKDAERWRKLMSVMVAADNFTHYIDAELEKTKCPPG